MDIDKLDREYKEIYDELIMPVDTNIKLDSVILSDINRKMIDDFIKEYTFRDKFIEYGLDPMNRLLFYGASGTGKTYLSKALANHLGFTMLYVDIANSLTDGSVSKNISNIFKLANHMGKCVIMLDECDSVAWKRDSSDSESGEIRRATNSIFQHLDQMNPDNIFISATNMLHRIDPAFKRRFSMELEFRKPELDLMESIRMFLHDKFELENDVESTIKTIVERRITLSYYEIQVIVEKAMKRALMNGTNIVSTSEIYMDIADAMKIRIRGTARL